MKGYLQIYVLFLVLVFCISCKEQNKTELQNENINAESKGVINPYGPNQITRNIIQDRKGNIWIASWEGIFRYDGKSFTNITSKVSSARFYSVLEDRRGNFWFGSIGSGVFRYDGKSFKNFTTRDGLTGNGVTCIYQDKTGNIWFGAEGGVSRYDGKSFRNYIINGDTMMEHRKGNTFSYRSAIEVNSIIEDKTGRFWIATRGNTFVYDGKTFTIFTHQGKPFMNVRSIIEDKKGNIWLGGPDGLWRYNGSTFTNFTQKFVGYIIEDRKGHIWTSSERDNSQPWALSRFDGKSVSYPAWALGQYEGKSLSNKKPRVTEIMNKLMIFGILEDDKGSIWFGAVDGLYRYNGSTITSFNGIEAQK